MGAHLRGLSGRETKIESERLTVADLIVPGTSRSIAAELKCLPRLFMGNGGH